MHTLQLKQALLLMDRCCAHGQHHDVPLSWLCCISCFLSGMPPAACSTSLTPAIMHAGSHVLSLEDVRSVVDKHHSIELPGFSPYSAVNDLIGSHQKDWATLCADCVAACQGHLSDLVVQHIQKTFAHFPKAADHVR